MSKLAITGSMLAPLASDLNAAGLWWPLGAGPPPPFDFVLVRQGQVALTAMELRQGRHGTAPSALPISGKLLRFAGMLTIRCSSRTGLTPLFFNLCAMSAW